MSSETVEPAASVPHLCDPLPPGAVLAHIGVHKTGTTSIQSVLAQQRAVLAEHGVTYPGSKAHHHTPALALTRTPWGPDATKGTPPDRREWEGLVAEVAAAPGRAVISSEFFADARGEHTEELVRDLGRDRLHVLIGVRHLAAVVPSHWQQTLKLGRVSSFDTWLRSVFDGPREVPNPRAFWSRYQYGALAQRWADLVGPDAVTVVVVDESDRSLLPRTFESLLDLPHGTLDGVAPRERNRSLSAGEAEALRQVNVMLKDRLRWPEYEAIIRRGAVVRMVEGREVGPDEARTTVPDWAVEASCEHGAVVAREIEASGVRVIGDLGRLAAQPRKRSSDDVRLGPDVVPVEALALAMYGATAGALGAGSKLPKKPRPGPHLVHLHSGRALARVALDRAKRQLRGRLR